MASTRISSPTSSLKRRLVVDGTGAWPHFRRRRRAAGGGKEDTRGSGGWPGGGEAGRVARRGAGRRRGRWSRNTGGTHDHRRPSLPHGGPAGDERRVFSDQQHGAFDPAAVVVALARPGIDV